MLVFLPPAVLGVVFFHRSPAIALPRAGASGGGAPKVGGEGGRAAGEAEAWPGGSASLLGGCLPPGVGRWMGTACGGPEYEMRGAAGLGQDGLKRVVFVSPLRTWETFLGTSPPLQEAGPMEEKRSEGFVAGIAQLAERQGWGEARDRRQGRGSLGGL